MEQNIPLEGRIPIWEEGRTRRAYPPLNGGDRQYDVAIVGAGITGLTAAAMLKEEGLRVVVLEARNIGAGVTGHTSAHLTQWLDAYFYHIRSNFDDASTRIAWQAGGEAIDIVEENVKRFRISCSFQRVDGWLYSEDQKGIEDIEKEMEAARDLDLSMERVSSVPLPFRVEGGLRVPNQAIFQPLNYLDGLAAAINDERCIIHEGTRVVDFDEKENYVEVNTDRGSIRADHVLLATHCPITKRFAITQSEVTPCRSYLLGLTLKSGTPPLGLFWDTDTPYHYTRRYQLGEHEYLLVGGADHRTGHVLDMNARFDEMERYVRDRWDVGSIDFRWSAQSYEPADGLPYVGRGPFSDRVFIATGYSGNGLTNGTISARIVADQMLGRNNIYGDVFDATRIKPVASAGHLAEATGEMIAHLVGDRFKEDVESVTAIKAGDGAVVDVDGEKTAAYRDENGSLHLLSPVCRHAGCIVHWNNAEKTWDCPCHGGRYDRYGNVLEGPPTSGLERKAEGEH